MIDMPVQEADLSAMVIHANWTHDALHLWCETSGGDQSQLEESDAPAHLFATRPVGVKGESSSILLRLPSIDGKPVPSRSMSRIMGRDTDEDSSAVLMEFRVPTIKVATIEIGPILESLVEATSSRTSGRVRRSNGDMARRGSGVAVLSRQRDDRCIERP